MAHTPGPWAVDGGCIIGPSGGYHIVCFGHEYDDYGGISAPYLGPSERESQARDDEADANARLIAASPALYDALSAIVRAWDGPIAQQEVAVAKCIQAARMALKQAEGQ